jgi:hypothetical protein
VAAQGDRACSTRAPAVPRSKERVTTRRRRVSTALPPDPVALLRELICFDTTNAPGNESPCIDHLQRARGGRSRERGVRTRLDAPESSAGCAAAGTRSRSSSTASFRARSSWSSTHASSRGQRPRTCSRSWHRCSATAWRSPCFATTRGLGCDCCSRRCAAAAFGAGRSGCGTANGRVSPRCKKAGATGPEPGASGVTGRSSAFRVGRG